MRRPAWSDVITRPVARVIPQRLRPAALTSIKTVHTVIFASIGLAIAVFVWDGIRQRPGRRAAYALGVTLAEAGVYVSNNQVCPLTPLAEELGSERGSVVDMFLPAWAARCIPLVGSAALLVGIVLNVRALAGERGR
jgi:hypothetical protein